MTSYLRWIQKAKDDITLAKYNYAAFHAQQAVKKLLKAFLIYTGKPMRKTHDIAVLIEECKEIDKSFEELYEIGAHYLTDFAVEVRYPSYFSVPKDNAKDAIKIAENVLEFILQKIK